mmetsp:Transcript_30450/g.46630  ORF Transcript_30450/g.46630 Transcript_30450/m.46630 type:complete len:84 (-) Transcript_30450:68-319(-)
MVRRCLNYFVRQEGVRIGLSLLQLSPSKWQIEWPMLLLKLPPFSSMKNVLEGWVTSSNPKTGISPTIVRLGDLVRARPRLVSR